MIEVRTLTIWMQREDDEDAYSVQILELPGCASQGDTTDEAMRNIAEALSGALDTYHACGMPVPWLDTHTTTTIGGQP